MFAFKTHLTQYTLQQVGSGSSWRTNAGQSNNALVQACSTAGIELLPKQSDA